MREAPAGRIISSKPKYSNAEMCVQSMCVHVGGLLNQPLWKNLILILLTPQRWVVGPLGTFSGDKPASLQHSRGPVVLSGWRVGIRSACKLHICPL